MLNIIKPFTANGKLFGFVRSSQLDFDDFFRDLFPDYALLKCVGDPLRENDWVCCRAVVNSLEEGYMMAKSSVNKSR